MEHTRDMAMARPHFTTATLLWIVIALFGCGDDPSPDPLAPYLGLYRVTTHLSTDACGLEQDQWPTGPEQTQYVRIEAAAIEGAAALCWIPCATLDDCQAPPDTTGQPTVMTPQTDGGVEGCARTFVRFPGDIFLWERDAWEAFSGSCTITRRADSLEREAGQLVITGHRSMTVIEASDNDACAASKAEMDDADFMCTRVERLVADPAP